MSHVAAKMVTGALVALSGFASAQTQQPSAAPKPQPSPSTQVLSPQGVYAQIDTRLG